jgi:hypothetical protein
MHACICPGGKCESSKFLLRRRFWLALAVVGKMDLKAGKNSKKLGGPSLLIGTIAPPTEVKREMRARGYVASPTCVLGEHVRWVEFVTTAAVWCSVSYPETFAVPNDEKAHTYPVDVLKPNPVT